MKKVNILLYLFFIPYLMFGQGKSSHPIDVWMEECQKTNESTHGLIVCAEEAYKKWDVELNKIYKELLAVLDLESQKKLKESQRAWVKFRDEEFKLLDSIYSKKDGTMFLPMHLFDKVEIVKNRTLELAGHLNLIKDL